MHFPSQRFRGRETHLFGWKRFAEKLKGTHVEKHFQENLVSRENQKRLVKGNK